MDIPLAQIFTFSNIESPNEDFDTLSWLAKQEDNVLNQIVESSDLFFQYNENDEDDSPPPFACVDYMTLCYMMAEKETGTSGLTDEVRENAIMGLALFAVYERMRRKDLITFSGNGKISEFKDNNTEIHLTEMGKMVGSSIKTLSEIANAMENS